MTPETLQAIKEALEASFQRAYFALIQHARSLPIHAGMMQKAFNHFDDGLFCVEKAIRMIQSLPVSAPIQADAAIAEKAVEVVEEGVKVAEGVVQDIENAKADSPAA